MHGKAEPVAASRPAAGARAATKEQLRIAQVTNQEGQQDEDRSRIQKMIKEIIETTRCSQSQAEIALHDASNNVEVAVNNILESANLDTWSHYKRKGIKGKDEVREELPVKKSGNRPPRRGQQNSDQNDGYQKRAPRTNENGQEGRENRKPREPRNKEDAEFRGGRGQQSRNRRDGGAPARRDTNKANLEGKEDGEDLWKGGSLVFNRREDAEEKVPQQQSAQPSLQQQPALVDDAKPATAQPQNPNRPLSFADIVRRGAPKPQPPAPPAAEPSPNKLPVASDAKRTSPSPQVNVESLSAVDDNPALSEPSKSPRQTNAHLDMESPVKLLHDENSVYNTQSSSQTQHLTDQLKNDLGLGAVSNAVPQPTFGSSPPKKYQHQHEPPQQSKLPSAAKAGIVEFVSGEAPSVSSGDWQFGFDASSTSLQQQQPIAPVASVVEEPHHHHQQQQQYHRESLPKAPEPQRNEINLANVAPVNEPNPPPRNASTILNQYVQQQPTSQPPHLQYAVHQSQQYNNRNRNGLNNLPFATNDYSNNFTPDLRSTYGAPASPPKSQNVQQPLQNLASQQPLPSQTQQPPHHQQHMFPPTQLPYSNYPYMNMYSPVAPTGMRDDFAPMGIPYQFSMNQIDLNALTLFPQLANVTSAGPLPNHQQAPHHQNSHPQQQQQQQSNQGSLPPQHSQNTHNQQPPNHQRNDQQHYSDMGKYLSNQMNIPPGSQQNNGSNGHGSQQQNSNLGNAQQRQQQQQLLDNNSQGSLTGNVAPPPGFGGPPNNIAAAPFMPGQRNIFPPTFQVPTFTAQFPYVMPNAQHKSK